MSETNNTLVKIRELFFKYVPLWSASFYLVAVSIFYALITAYLPTQNGDNIEHIHSSFMVAQGLVPYRDFFQHHNPLLWYLFAPLAQLFAYNTTIAEVACLISFLFFLKSLTFVYRIVVEFLGDKLWGLIAAIMITVPSTKLYAIDFRPDNYMVFCLMGGIYYYFDYLKNKQRVQLEIAFVWFFVSFMFAQKALFPLFILGLTGLYFWYKKEIKTEDMLKALIFPVIGCLCFLGYLFYYDMVALYFKCNYAFNLNLAAQFDMTKVATFPLYMKIVIFIGWVGVFYSLCAGNRYSRILSLLFVSEFFQREFYFSPYSYYYWFLYYLAALCAVPVLCQMNKNNRLVSVVALIGLFVIFLQSVFIYYQYWQEQKDRFYLPDYITRKITPCDYVFNGDGMMYNIFAKDPAYYWQLIGQLDVIGEQTGIRPKPDINALIIKHKPMFVFGRNYFNKFSEESGRKEIVHYVDQKLIDKYYDKTSFYPVFQLKKQYHKTCWQAKKH